MRTALRPHRKSDVCFSTHFSRSVVFKCYLSISQVFTFLRQSSKAANWQFLRLCPAYRKFILLILLLLVFVVDGFFFVTVHRSRIKQIKSNKKQNPNMCDEHSSLLPVLSRVQLPQYNFEPSVDSSCRRGSFGARVDISCGAHGGDA